MKSGKPQIHNLPINDVTTQGAYAFELQQEVEARGEVLPPAARLHIDYLATGNQLIKTITYVLDSSYTNIRYVEAEVGEGNSAERRYWLYAFDIITGFSGQPWNLGKSEEQRKECKPSSCHLLLLSGMCRERKEYDAFYALC